MASKYSKSEINEMRSSLNAINEAMKALNCSVGIDNVIRSKDVVMLKRFSRSEYSSDYEYITAGSYLTGNNFINVYVDKAGTQTLLSNSEAYLNKTLLARIFIAGLVKSAPVVVILVIVDGMAASEYNQIDSAF